MNKDINILLDIQYSEPGRLVTKTLILYSIDDVVYKITLKCFTRNY